MLWLWRCIKHLYRHSRQLATSLYRKGWERCQNISFFFHTVSNDLINCVPCFKFHCFQTIKNFVLNIIFLIHRQKYSWLIWKISFVYYTLTFVNSLIISTYYLSQMIALLMYGLALVLRNIVVYLLILLWIKELLLCHFCLFLYILNFKKCYAQK